VQHAQREALRHGPVGGVRRAQRFVLQHLHDGIELWIDCGDSIEVRLHDLA